MLVLDQEKRTKIKLEKKNREINERCKRIHNAKWMQNGIDKEALDKQVGERKEREALERKSNDVYEKTWLCNLQKADELEKKQSEVKRSLEKEIVEYRRVHQAPHTRISFDLNDPDRLKKETLPNLDDHHVVGPSSAQNYIGEDCNKRVRSKLQIEQNRAWLDQQVFEKRTRDEEERTLEEHYLHEVGTIQEMMCKQMQREREEKQKIMREIIHFNKTLANDKVKREQAEKNIKPEGDGYTLISYFGPALSEENSKPQSGGGRATASTFRGFTEEQKKQFRKALELQVEDMKKRRELECRSDLEWEKQFVQLYREALLCGRAEERKKKELTKQLFEENKKMATEKAKKKAIENQSYRAPVSKEFLDLFEISP